MPKKYECWKNINNEHLERGLGRYYTVLLRGLSCNGKIFELYKTVLVKLNTYHILSLVLFLTVFDLIDYDLDYFLFRN